MVESTNIEPQQQQQELGTTIPPEDDINEVYERVYMSGLPAAASLETMQKNGITHIVRVTPT